MVQGTIAGGNTSAERWIRRKGLACCFLNLLVDANDPALFNHVNMVNNNVACEYQLYYVKATTTAHHSRAGCLNIFQRASVAFRQLLPSAPNKCSS
jgi:hypothetical protein